MILNAVNKYEWTVKTLIKNFDAKAFDIDPFTAQVFNSDEEMDALLSDILIGMPINLYLEQIVMATEPTLRWMFLRNDGQACAIYKYIKCGYKPMHLYENQELERVAFDNLQDKLKEKILSKKLNVFIVPTTAPRLVADKLAISKF